MTHTLKIGRGSGFSRVDFIAFTDASRRET
jgi:hypothetical protein